jgi:methenyltetrahydrofolate cyclohydrolase
MRRDEPSGFSERPFRELLDEVAARTPAPGGGASAACACALAAALVEMAATFSPRHGDMAHRARELRTRSLELAEDELRAYEPVLDAIRLPSEDPTRTERIRAAQVEASKPPLAIARVAAEVAELGSHVARTGNQNLAGDAISLPRRCSPKPPGRRRPAWCGSISVTTRLSGKRPRWRGVPGLHGRKR